MLKLLIYLILYVTVLHKYISSSGGDKASLEWRYRMVGLIEAKVIVPSLEKLVQHIFSFLVQNSYLVKIVF